VTLPQAGVRAPRTSVCLPVYNAAVTLPATLDSLWRQSDQDFEVIAVDDGSTDRSYQVLAAQRDPRLRIIRQERNRGEATATSTAVAAACGRYVKFLHADDLLSEDCLAFSATTWTPTPPSASCAAPDVSSSTVWTERTPRGGPMRTKTSTSTGTAPRQAAAGESLVLDYCGTS
jgi:glycosyltransferase involved in cell wall biosynthesis